MKCSECGEETNQVYEWVTGFLCEKCFESALEKGFENLNRYLAEKERKRKL